MQGYSSKGKHNNAKTFYNKSESLCEDALEILQELLHYDSTLRVWFDRDISFEVGGELSADIVSLPRLVTSRSHEKLSDDSNSVVTCLFNFLYKCTKRLQPNQRLILYVKQMCKLNIILNQ